MKKMVMVLVMALLVSIVVFADSNITSMVDVDAFTGQSTSYMFVNGDNGVGVLVFKFVGSVTSPTKFDVFVSESYTYYGSSNLEVLFKFGKAVINSKWDISTDGGGLFCPAPGPFLTLAKKNKSLVLRVYDYQEIPHNYKFNLTDFNSVFNSLVKGKGK